MYRLRLKRRVEDYIFKERLGIVLLVLVLIGGFLSNIEIEEKNEVKFWQVKNWGEEQIIKVSVNNRVESMSLDDYLVGVVAGEMPALYNLEALKAQSVAARTYALRWLERNDNIVADPSVAQSYITVDEMHSRWGSNFDIYYKKIEDAVKDTHNEVLMWQGELVDALYSASCGGVCTASASEVWGGNVEYLKSVRCNHLPNSSDKEEKSFSAKAIKSLLGVNIENIAINKYTQSNRVLEVKVGDEFYSGEKFRKILGLKSTLFSFKIKDNNLVVTSLGYGHGVGMCQLGANYYASKGWNYKKILLYYYTNAQISKI